MDEIQELVAHEKIKKQLYTYCKGIDTRDWALVRSCFGAGHKHIHPPFSGTLDEFVSFASENLKVIKTSHHSISNLIIDIADDGLSANTEAYFRAFHLIEASDATKLSFETGGVDTDWTVAGAYVDRWVCQDGVWLIVERNARHIWERIVPSKPPTKKT